MDHKSTHSLSGGRTVTTYTDGGVQYWAPSAHVIRKIATRDNGPSCIRPGGNIFYQSADALDRKEGPCTYISREGTVSYYRDGKSQTEEKFLAKVMQEGF